MKPLHFIFFGLWSLASLCIQSCKEECCSDPTNPDCKNYDPCFGKEPANASFHFYRDLSNEYGQYHFQTDTIEVFSDGSYVDVIFKVDDKNVDSCWWTIGADSRVFTQKELHLLFQRDDSPIFTKLIVNKSSAKTCFPDKPDRDTFYRKLTFMPLGTSSIYGIYSGYFDGNSKDSGLISVSLKRLTGDYIPILRNSQETPGIDSSNFHLVTLGWNSTFGIRANQGLPSMDGFAKIDGKNIEIKYRYRIKGDPSGIYRNRTFNGIKQ